jgi:glutathione S-transferase
MIKIWGRNNSSNVQKVMWVVSELGLAHERIDIGGAFGKNREPDYLAKNPNGLVPTLEEDDGFVLWESHAIMCYLAAKHHHPIEPADPKSRALAHQWMDWQQTVLAPAMFPVFVGLVRTPPEKRDEAAIAAGKIKTIEAMKMVDAQLARTKYMAGDAFSYGDIPIAIFGRRFRDLIAERPNYAHFERWYAEVSARPAFQEHVGAIPLS